VTDRRTDRNGKSISRSASLAHASVTRQKNLKSSFCHAEFLFISENADSKIEILNMRFNVPLVYYFWTSRKWRPSPGRTIF